MSGRTLHRKYHFILAKLLGFQSTFHEKYFVSGFGADAPTDNAHEKTRRNPRFCYFFFLLIITALIIMVAADIMHIDKIRIVLYVPVSVCVPLLVVFAEAAVL